MLFTFLRKQKKDSEKKILIKTMIESLHVSSDQKSMYTEAVDILYGEDLETLYKKLSHFVEKLEMKELENIQEHDFAMVAGMRKKEAKEKIEEVNSFSFLLNNL